MSEKVSGSFSVRDVIQKKMLKYITDRKNIYIYTAFDNPSLSIYIFH